MKNRPRTSLRSQPDASPMPFHDLFAQRQSNARALIPLSRVKALKNDKDALEELVLDSDAVVLD